MQRFALVADCACAGMAAGQTTKGATVSALAKLSARRRAANRARGEARPHRRVRARPIYEDTRVKITRRCHDRRMYLTPFGDPRRGHTAEETANFCGYTFARAQRLYGFKFHAATVMGNHHHLDATDVRGNRPYFKNSIHSVMARGFNARFGRFDSMWSGGGSCDTVTPSDDQALEGIAYTDVNAVSAGLVKWAEDWPGFSTYGWRFGETRVFIRPHWFFDPKNPDNPETIRLTRVRPNIFPELSDDELFDRLMEKCREVEAKCHGEMKAANRRFMGIKKLQRTKWWKRAKSPEARFKTVPTVASSQADLRAAELARQAAWRAAYADALDKNDRGEPAALPFGAFLLVRYYGFPMADAPADMPDSVVVECVEKPP